MTNRQGRRRRHKRHKARNVNRGMRLRLATNLRHVMEVTGSHSVRAVAYFPDMRKLMTLAMVEAFQ